MEGLGNSSSKKEKVKAWFKDPLNWVFLGILLAAIVLRLYYFSVTSNQPLWWDESEYALKAKNLAFGTPETGYSAMRPIFLPLMAAVIFKLGLGETGVRFLLELIPSVLLVLFTYLLGKEMFNKQVGLIASAFSAFNWLIIFETYRIQTEIPLMAFAVMSMYFFWKFYNNRKNSFLLLAAGFAILATLMKFTGGLLFAVYFLFFLFTDRTFFKTKLFRTLFISFLALLAIVFIWQFIKFGNPLYFFIEAAKGFGMVKNPSFALVIDSISNIWLMLNDYTGYFIIVFILSFLFIVFNLVLGASLIKENHSLKKDLFLLFITLYSIIFMIAISTPYDNRYCLLAVFGIYILMGSCIQKVIEKIKLKNILAIALIVLLVASLFLTNISPTKSLLYGKLDSYLQVKESGLWIKENSNKDDIIISASLPQHTYYSERAVYGYDQNESAFDEMIQKLKPKYMVISAFEPDYTPQWSYDWPQRHNETVRPVQAYYMDSGQKQLALVVYEFIYT